ncbi:MAG: class I SAM-dependent RNA methyltransferase [Dactylosporangium sp.]|nr:TRAM domain-containing protein [Dactylosporangium sp.]NNJ62148.1 class I SAM-dependent RNA methyltransferase [Dactylosporangium sp.]
MTAREPDTIDLDVGPIAHGGHCVARADGRVVFVRHALPGERVRAVVTATRGRYLRADAVEVLEAAPDRVASPCPYSGPGGCGGCDFQHVAPAAQRRLKAAIVREQLVRVAGIPDRPVTVEALPGGASGWRTRVRYLADAGGRLGLRRHRSHEIVPVDRCRIAHPDIQDLPLTGERWTPGEVVEAVRGSSGDPVVWRGSERRAGNRAGGRGAGPHRSLAGPTVVEQVFDRRFTIAASGFWQVHPGAATALATAVIELLDPGRGERAWDLYGGAGLFAAAIAERVGTGGRVTVVESARDSVAAARRCLADLPQVRIVGGDVASALSNPRWRSVDLVVADPPRTGLGPEVVPRIVERAPRAIAYVSCDPATFARDLRTFATHGYALAGLRAFDAFPMTHHVEVVGLLTAP